VDLEVFPAAVDLNGVVYDGRLFDGVDVVVTSSAVRGRFTADPARYAAACRFYRLLDSTATVLTRIAPGDQLSGPEIVAYRLGPWAHEALAASRPPDPLWWVVGVPAEYRRRATGALGARWEGGAPWSALGQPAPWVRSLAGVYDERLRPFVEDMAVNLLDLGRFDEARPFAEATLLLLPDDPVARMAYDVCIRHRGPPAPGVPPRSAPRSSPSPVPLPAGRNGPGRAGTQGPRPDCLGPHPPPTSAQTRVLRTVVAGETVYEADVH
jgi:hypothetical protein